MINENGASTSATSTKDTVPSFPGIVLKLQKMHPYCNGHKQSAVFTATAEHVLAAPITRKTAREMGVDTSQLAWSCPLGRITMEDVKNVALVATNMPTHAYSHISSTAGPPCQHTSSAIPPVQSLSEK
ncbi:MAG: E3 binding domain-containing protein [Bdellovibrionota bacterium]